MDVPCIYNAPGGFLCSPVERVLAFIKSVNLGLEEVEGHFNAENEEVEWDKKTAKDKLCLAISRRLQKLEKSSIIGMFERS